MSNVLIDPTFVIEPSPHLLTWPIASMREQGVNVGKAITDYFGFLEPPVTNLLEDTDFEASIDSAELRANGSEQDWYDSRNDVPDKLTLDEAIIGGNDTKGTFV